MNAAPHTVIVAGGVAGPFGRHPEAALAALAAPVVAGSLDQAGLEARDVQAAFVGNAFGGALQNQESILGQVLLAPLGIAGVPVHTIKNACSSGADAVHLAWSAIAYGQYDCVLALGAEKLLPEKARAFAALASATDHPPAGEGRSVFMDINAERTRRYMERHGAEARHFALAAAKNRRHASLNPNAALREPATAEAILADKIVVAPLTRGMCGGLADGAAAVVLVSEQFARRRGIAGPRIAASAVVSGLGSVGARCARPAPTDETSNRETALSADSGGGALAGGDKSARSAPLRDEGFASATKRAGLLAFQRSGVAPTDISLAEVHDPTAPQELFDIEELGLAPPGGAIALTVTGATALGGRLPVNVSGGLVARGHPVGATGVAQIAEIAEQLMGRAGARQVAGAKVGLAQMAGGLLGRDSAVAAVHILVR
jgi:acetyl-CoA acyltransferase